MGETSFAPYPVAMYAVIGFGASFAYYLLTKDLLSLHENTTSLSQALGKDIKGKTSILFNALAIVFAPYNPAVSITFFMLTGLMWFVPDRRIERILNA